MTTCAIFVKKITMERKEDYIGYEDQELCNKYYAEAEALRRKNDYPRMKSMQALSKCEQLRVPGQLGTRPGTGIKYVNINTSGGDRL